MKTIRKGDTGDEVKQLQSLLGIKSDGVIGADTENKVMEFQKKNDLVNDGIVGNKTWSKLLTNVNSIYRLNLIKSIRPIKEIILHCSATPKGEDYTVDDIRKCHLQRGFKDIGYHYYIYRDGSVHQGRNINENGAHTTNHNSNTIGVCYCGGCVSRNIPNWMNKPEDTRTPEQKESLFVLVISLMKMYSLKVENIKGHYEYTKNKACPSFNMDEFRKELKNRLNKFCYI